jgi:hypothetical protein
MCNGNRMGHEFAQGFELLVSSHAATPETIRSLASSIDLLHHGSMHSQRSCQKPETNDEAIQNETYQLGFSFSHGVEESCFESEGTDGKGKLELLAETQVELLEDEIATIVTGYSMRPSEVVRLLNSTNLGTVLNERQLYRHRQKATKIHAGPKRINFIAYCAWLHRTRHSKPKNQKRRTFKNRDVLTLGELKSILDAQNYRCALSGEELTPENVALDHIVPVIEGGDFIASNCQLVTSAVNRAKNTMSERDFIAMCIRVSKTRGNASYQ